MITAKKIQLTCANHFKLHQVSCRKNTKTGRTEIIGDLKSRTNPKKLASSQEMVGDVVRSRSVEIFRCDHEAIVVVQRILTCEIGYVRCGMGVV